MTTSIELYHGSTVCSIGGFKRLSHFGTKAAACAAAFAAKTSRGKNSAYLYSVNISYKPGEIVQFADWGGSSAFSLLVCLAELYPNQFEALRSQTNNATPARVNGIVDRDDYRAMRESTSLSIVLPHFQSNGVKLISYVNKVEDAGSGLSYCVIDPQIISNIRKRKMTSDELDIGAGKLTPERAITLGS